MDRTLQNQYLALIHTAIASQQVLQLKIKNAWRTVEPYVVGIDRTDKTAKLYGYCRDVVPTQPFDQSRWQEFSLQEVETMELTYYCFQINPFYNRHPKQLQPVLLRLAA